MPQDIKITSPQLGHHGGKLNPHYHEYGLGPKDEDDNAQITHPSLGRFALIAAGTFVPMFVLLMHSFG